MENTKIKNCLFNGNYKLGKLSGGFHKVENLESRKIAKPDGLPKGARSFLYFSGNIVLYTLENNRAVYNTDATGKLTENQKAGLDYIQQVLKTKKYTLENKALGWKNTGGGKSVSLDDKIAGML